MDPVDPVSDPDPQYWQRCDSPEFEFMVGGGLNPLVEVIVNGKEENS